MVNAYKNTLEDNGAVLFAASSGFDKQVGEIFAPPSQVFPEMASPFRSIWILFFFIAKHKSVLLINILTDFTAVIF